MSKFYKEIAGQHFEVLEKAIYRKEVGQITDPMDLYLPLLALPRTLISWLVTNVKKIPNGSTEAFNVPGSECILNVTKIAEDLYRGEILKNKKIIHRFEPTSLPALGGHLLNVCELYEEVAGRPVAEIEKKELIEKASESDKVKGLIDKLGDLIDKITSSQIKKEEIPAAAPQAPQPVVVNISLSNIGNDGSGIKAETKPAEEIKKEELDKGQPVKGQAKRRAQIGLLIDRNTPPNPSLTEGVQGIAAGLEESAKLKTPDPLDTKDKGNYITHVSQSGEPLVTTTQPFSEKGVLPRIPQQGRSEIGGLLADKKKDAALSRAKNIFDKLKAQKKPDLPKTELDKAKMDEGKNDWDKLKARRARSESEKEPAGTLEDFHKEGRNTPIGKMTRWSRLHSSIMSRKKPNLPKEELDKASKPPAYDKPTKAIPMQPQAPMKPMGPQKGNSKQPSLNMPQNAAVPSFKKPTTPGATMKPPQPKAPPAQKQLKQAISSVSKEELESAKSDDGKPMFRKDDDGYKFNPTGVHAVFTKNSVLVKKNDDSTYNLFVNDREWDKDNVELLTSMIKLKRMMKKIGF